MVRHEWFAVTVALQYYDVVLAGIAGSILLGAAIGLVTDLPLLVTVPAMCLVAIVIMGHALFVNGPVDNIHDLADEVDPEDIPLVATATESLN